MWLLERHLPTYLRLFNYISVRLLTTPFSTMGAGCTRNEPGKTSQLLYAWQIVHFKTIQCGARHVWIEVGGRAIQWCPPFQVVQFSVVLADFHPKHHICHDFSQFPPTFPLDPPLAHDGKANRCRKEPGSLAEGPDWPAPAPPFSHLIRMQSARGSVVRLRMVVVLEIFWSVGVSKSSNNTWSVSYIQRRVVE